MKLYILHKKLVEATPELEQAYKEELEDWDEFPGNHNIFGNVLNPFLVELLEQPNKENLKQRIFDFLELMALSEDVKVQEILIVTVLERLGDSEGVLREAKKYMGKMTIQFSEEVEKWLGRS